MSKPDYYSLLGVSPTASADHIRRAYRALAKRLHPDTNSSKDAAAEFARVAEAYQTLGNAEKRREYDRSRSPGIPRARSEGDDQAHYTWVSVAAPRSDAPADVSEIDALYDTFFVPHGEKARVRPGGKKR